MTSKSDPYLVMSAVELLHARYVELRDQQHASQDNHQRSNIYSVLNDTSGNTKSRLPLLINTDGWIRYMGAEILRHIIKTFSPTHVLHIYSEKDRELDALRAVPDDCEVLSLQPGRSTAGKVAATDLRTLRLVAHFLRRSEAICKEFELSDSVPIFIRNGSIIDTRGVVAARSIQLSTHISLK